MMIEIAFISQTLLGKARTISIAIDCYAITKFMVVVKLISETVCPRNVRQSTAFYAFQKNEQKVCSRWVVASTSYANRKNYNTALELTCECATRNCEYIILPHKRFYAHLEKIPLIYVPFNVGENKMRHNFSIH